MNQDGFADALAASDLAYAWQYPILMVGATSIPAATAEYHVENCADIDEIVAIGGTSAISAAVLDGAVAAATCGVPAVTSVTLAISDETARTITLDCDWDGDPLGSGTVKLTAVNAGTAANELYVNFVPDADPNARGLEVDGFELTYTDNFESLDEKTFVANWNAEDGGNYFTASGGVTDVDMTEEPDDIGPYDDYGCNDDVLGEATMTIVVNFNIPSVPPADDIDEFDWEIYSGSNPSTGDFLLSDEWCDDDSWAEDFLSYTCVVEDATVLTDDSSILEPRVGVDSFRIGSFEFFGAIGFEENDGQLVTLSAPC
ncbi:MAG: cell wall-binding repeat-containing protein, partial [Ilumatobacteraceae bacterium]